MAIGLDGFPGSLLLSQFAKTQANQRIEELSPASKQRTWRRLSNINFLNKLDDRFVYFNNCKRVADACSLGIL